MTRLQFQRIDFDVEAANWITRAYSKVEAEVGDSVWLTSDDHSVDQLRRIWKTALLTERNVAAGRRFRSIMLGTLLG
jgi:hypothetical protein